MYEKKRQPVTESDQLFRVVTPCSVRKLDKRAGKRARNDKDDR